MPIPPVDPDHPYRGPAWLAEPYARFARTAFGRWLGINILTPVDPYLLKWSKGRFSIFMIYHHVQLTVPGHKSGTPRTVQLLYFTEGDEVIVMASSFGRPDYPAWYRNVTAHPQVVLTATGASHDYVARETEGAEHDDLLAKAVRLYPGFGDYQQMVAEAGRHLPVLALRPA